MNLTITAADWHRNGISGMGFYAILFDNQDEKKKMVAALFDEPGYCAVYDIAQLAGGNVEFAAGNSWRGDVYAGALRPLLDKFLKEKGSCRFGPFSIPKPEHIERQAAKFKTKEKK